jgi:hypothetical protein
MVCPFAASPVKIFCHLDSRPFRHSGLRPFFSPRHSRNYSRLKSATNVPKDAVEWRNIRDEGQDHRSPQDRHSERPMPKVGRDLLFRAQPHSNLFGVSDRAWDSWDRKAPQRARVASSAIWVPGSKRVACHPFYSIVIAPMEIVSTRTERELLSWIWRF